MRILFPAIALIASLVATPAWAGDLTVKLTGVKAKGGTLLVGLYDQATFFRAKPPYLAEVKVSAAGDVTVTIKDVAAGDYAISALHDANDDQKMTMGADGRFGEGSALSNAEKLRGPPTFDIAKIAVPAEGLTTTVAMSYPEDRTGW